MLIGIIQWACVAFTPQPQQTPVDLN